MRSIALMGYARSGKDTAGAHLVERHGFQRVSFADGVRDSLLALDPIVDTFSDRDPETRHRTTRVRSTRLSEIVNRYGWEHAKDAHPEVRALLQRMGTDAVRDVIDPWAWIHLAGRKIMTAHEVGDPVVVTDVRFDNEARTLRELGFLRVWVSRPGCTPVNGHASECALTAADAEVVVINAWGKSELHAQISELAE